MLSKLGKDVSYENLLVKNWIMNRNYELYVVQILSALPKLDNPKWSENLKSMWGKSWGKSWGRKMNTSVFETEQSLYSIDIIELLNGSGERIRTFDLRMMSPILIRFPQFLPCKEIVVPAFFILKVFSSSLLHSFSHSSPEGIWTGI